MSISSILLTIDNTAESARRQRAAQELAQRFDAHLKAIALALQPAPVVYGESYGAEVYVMAQAELQRDADQVKEAAIALAERSGVAIECATLSGIGASANAAIAEHALYTDLAVLGAPRDNAPLNQRLIEGVLFESPAPALVWPDGRDAVPAPGARVLLAWDARREAAVAARQAAPFLRQATQVHVAAVTDALGFEPFGEDPGYAFCEWLTRQGCVVELHQIDRMRVAEALLETARNAACELIVMGGYGHSRLRQALFGGVTETMLRTSEIPLLLAH